MAIPEIRLTPEDRKRLEELQADIVALERELRKAEECELDVAQLRADFDKAKRQREAILRIYG